MWNRMTPVLERRRIRVPAAPQEPRREIAPPPAAVVDSIVRFHLLTCLDVRIAGRVSVGGIAVSGISVAVVAARCCSSDGSSTDGAHCQRHAVASATIVAVYTAIATTHSDATVRDATAGTTNRNASIGNAAAAPV